MNGSAMTLNHRLVLPISFGLSVLLAVSSSARADDRWQRRAYDQPFACGSHQYVVHSVCDVDTEIGNHNICNDQRLILLDGNDRKHSADLLGKQTEREEPKQVEELACVGKADKSHIEVLLSTGGNCAGCEASGILSLDAQWVEYNGKWFVTKSKRKLYASHEKETGRASWEVIVTDEAHRVELAKGEEN